jgi:hypothetical protein
MLPPHGTNGHFFTDIPAPRKPPASTEPDAP